MTRKRTSLIWTISKEEIQKILNESCSFVEVLKKLGLCEHSGNHRTLKERIEFDDLNIEALKEKRIELTKKRLVKEKIPLSEILVENSNYRDSKSLKKRLLDDNLLKYVCEKCNNDGSWMGHKLTLQLEHKNGDHKDNRLENLCFLCPNCHSQTETYAGRNSSLKKSRICIDCKGKTKGKGSKCLKCVHRKQQKFFVTKNELEELVKKLPMTKIGIKFGVSDNAIRKRCRKLGVDWKNKQD